MGDRRGDHTGGFGSGDKLVSRTPTLALAVSELSAFLEELGLDGRARVHGQSFVGGVDPFLRDERASLPPVMLEMV